MLFSILLNMILFQALIFFFLILLNDLFSLVALKIDKLTFFVVILDISHEIFAVTIIIDLDHGCILDCLVHVVLIL